MSVIKKIDKILVEKDNTLNEAQWSKNPYQYKRDLSSMLVDMGHWIRNISVSDRYYSGIDHSPKEKVYVDKVFKLIGDAVKNLDSVINKAKKIKY